MLTHQACTKAKPTGKKYQMRDGNGLFLEISAKGNKRFLARFRAAGTLHSIPLGKFPETALADARVALARIKAATVAGEDPRSAVNGDSAHRFEHIARQWLEVQESKWSPQTRKLITRRLERYVLPKLGEKTFDEITPSMVLDVVQSVEGHGLTDTSRRVKQYIANVFDFAKFEGLNATNPVDGINVRLKPLPKTRHMPFIAPKDMPAFFARFRSYEGERQTRILMEIVIRTFVRTTEIRSGQWSEINGDVWTIPGNRMKMGRDHIVPLAPQVVELFRELREVGKDESQWLVSRGTNLRPKGDAMCAISENGMLYALYNIGYKGKATMHGFRRTASTFLNECGRFRPDVIEMQLAHVEGNKVRGAYNAAEYLRERRDMMRHYNNWIDQQIETSKLLG